MATTMGQALAERIRYQTESGKKVLEAAGDHHGAVFGNPADVLTVTGNVSDIAYTNHLWLLDAVASGAVKADLGEELSKTRPATVEQAVDFLGARETDTPAQAIDSLKKVNDRFSTLVKGLSDEELEAPVEVTFYGQKSLRDLLFIVIEHGSLHLGQSWGILKGKGAA